MSSEPTRRFQRSHERPRSARRITADVDPETIVRLGESRYHDAVVFPDGSVLGQCSSIDADTGTLQDAANRGLRPCKSCQPDDYLADPDTEDVIEERSVDELATTLEELGTDDAVGLTWRPRRGRGPITAEGLARDSDQVDGRTLVVVDAVTHKAPLVVREGLDDCLTVFSRTVGGEQPLGVLLDVFPLDAVAGDTAPGDRDEPEVVTDGGEDDTDEEDESNAHASAVAETLWKASDEDLEATGIDPDDYRDEDGDRDE